MSKCYFRADEETCETIEGHQEYMKENGLKELEVFEAKRETGTEYFFCLHHLEVGVSGESCGKNWCENYIPNNGKNGRCKHYGYVYENTGKKRILKI